MTDLYLQENSSVLKNLLGITDEKELDLAEAELSRANMMLLYENGFSDFSVGGISFIHKEFFGDVYDSRHFQSVFAGLKRLYELIERQIAELVYPVCYIVQFL